jgi:serine/threonine protein kinase
LKTIGKYELGERIAHGGMGVIFAGRNPSLDQPVAIKVLRADFSAPDAAERFAREARAASRLKHPNIVRVFDFGQDGDQWFIVMERIVGETFDQLAARQAPLTLAERLLLFDQVCSAVSYAHRHGWVHRDLKPSNLMLDSEEGVVKVLDFGLARQVEVGMTQLGMVLGSPNYMSPEQVRGETVDARTDVFSATAVLFHLLTYTKAFSGRDADQAMHAVLHDQPPPVSALDPTLPAPLDAVIAKGLAKDREARFQSIDAMRQAIREAVPFAIPAHDSASFSNSDRTVVRPKPPATGTREAATQPRRWGAAAMASAGLMVAVAVIVTALQFRPTDESPETPAPLVVEKPDPGPTPPPRAPEPDTTAVTPAPANETPPKPAPPAPNSNTTMPVASPDPLPPVARPSQQNDAQQILQLLERVAAAYSRMDAKGVAAMTDVPAGDLEYSFSRYRAYRMAIEPTSSPSIDGDKATVEARRRTQVTLQSGEQPPVEEGVTFELVRRGSGWQVTRSVRH